MYVDIYCQWICKISCKKTTEVKIFQKVLRGGATFLKHPVQWCS